MILTPEQREIGRRNFLRARACIAATEAAINSGERKVTL
jgi:hypothetical protein